MSKDVNNKQTAEKLFASTTHNVLWANPKGEFFTSENIGSMSLKAGQKLTKFERAEETKNESLKVATDEKVYEVNVKDTIVKIKEVSSLEALKEFESDERKSVKQVYDWKKNLLIAALDVDVKNGNEDTDTQK